MHADIHENYELFLQGNKIKADIECSLGYDIKHAALTIVTRNVSKLTNIYPVKSIDFP